VFPARKILRLVFSAGEGPRESARASIHCASIARSINCFYLVRKVIGLKNNRPPGNQDRGQKERVPGIVRADGRDGI